MRKAWWQVVVIVVCVAGGALAVDVQGPSSLELGSPGAPESASGPPAASRLSTADRLQAMSAEERSNARLSLEALTSLGDIERKLALQVEALWAEGRYDEAIGLLSQLEAGGARLAAGIAWLKPLAGAPKVGRDDVRIGGTRVGAQDVALDFDQATGNLFAVVAWQNEWTVNISTDDGTTWSETVELSVSRLVDAAVVGEYLYVAYAPWDLTSARTRRFFVTDGLPDNAYSYHEVANVSPNTILDVSVGANADGASNRIYLYFIESDNALRYFWDEAWDGTSWTDNSPPVSDAASDLDYHRSGGTLYHSWITYWGTDGTGHVLGRSWAGGWSAPHATLVTPTDHRVRVSAFGDTVFVSYQDDWAGAGQLSASYDVTYDEGGGWSAGDAYVPAAGEPGCWGMDITARGGWGSAAIYNREEGAFDYAYVTTREDYHSGPWSPPEAFNDVDAVSGGPSFIQFLRPLGAVGVVYLAGSSLPTAIPYFDAIALMPFDDGFETGDTSGWSDAVP